jgi:hypothetical protein
MAHSMKHGVIAFLFSGNKALTAIRPPIRIEVAFGKPGASTTLLLCALSVVFSVSSLPTASC